MLHDFHSFFDTVLGLELDAKDINAGQMSLRAVIVFIIAMTMVRIGHKRFMGKSTALDVILGIMFGSMISRAISGTAPFLPTLAACFTLILLHWVFSWLAFRWPAFGDFCKGYHELLVKDGQPQPSMQHAHITDNDLEEAMRMSGKKPVVQDIRSAHLERNGEISILS